MISDGEKAKETVLQYADWLVTTCNDTIPDESWRLPVPHPSSILLCHIANSDSDYQDLTNSVERHTNCNSAYCERKKRGEQKPSCRFNYPRPTQSQSTLTFERLPDNTIRATLTTRRNDPRVNSHSRLFLQNWRANVDLQVIVDVQACARYMAKYAAKGEPRSNAVSSIFKSCVNTLSSSSDARSVLRRAMIRAVGERDFAAQETAHMLLSLPLVSCTFTFVTLSLTGSQRLVEDEDSGMLVIQKSLYDYYVTRNSNFDMSLLQFASEFSIFKGEAKR